MVEYARASDDIKAAGLKDLIQSQNIRLTVNNMRDVIFGRFADGVSQAGAAQVYRCNFGFGKGPGKIDGFITRSAPCVQNFYFSFRDNVTDRREINRIFYIRHIT